MICNKSAMEKDFDEWNKKKKVIEVLLGVPGFHERELWYLA